MFDEIFMFGVIAAFTVENIFLSIWFLSLLLTRKRIQKKRVQNAETRKKLFTLPDRDNTFIRARLSTVLSPLATASSVHACGIEPLDFTAALELLQRVEKANLTPAERVGIQRIALEMEAYAKDKEWTTQTALAVNKTFLVILKLCGKYSV